VYRKPNSAIVVMRSAQSLCPSARTSGDQLRTIFSSASAPKMDKPNFELMIGTSASGDPGRLPAEATQVLKGYLGSQNMMAGRDLVVVDQHTRRVAAIISGVGN
jgi:hypothetical protein